MMLWMKELMNGKKADDSETEYFKKNQQMMGTVA